MPIRVLPPNLQNRVDVTVQKVTERLSTPDGIKLQRELRAGRQWLVETPPLLKTMERRVAAAKVAVDWLRQMPEELAASAAVPLIDLSLLPQKEAAQSLAQGFDVLALSINALIHSDTKLDKFDVDRAIKTSFGNDNLARKLKGELVKPVFPDFQLPKDFTFPDLDKLIAAGNLRDHLNRLVDCGRIARGRLQFASQTFGEIVSIDPPKACNGTVIRITFKDFTANPPDNGWDLQLALPMLSGKHASIRMRDIEPDLFDVGKWKQQGYFDIKLPPGIGSGNVGFFLLPPPVGCTERGFLTTALMVQDTIGKNDPGGAAVFEAIIRFVVDAAEYLRLSGVSAVPLAQDNGANFLRAGAPVIDYFRIRNGSPVFPHNEITIEWKVRNAEAISIQPRAVNGSEHPHPLPPIAVTPDQVEISKTLAIDCSTNWRGEYVLTATNQSGCGQAEMVQPVNSGFRHYRLGTARQKFAFVIPPKKLRMLGFSDEKQEATYQLHDISARAFIVAENNASVSAARVAIVVMDLWGCSQAVKETVAAQVASDPALAAAGYSASNILICGTHTHSAPGGFFHNYLYNLTLDGFDQAVFDHIVFVVTTAIRNAHNNLAPGRLQLAEGKVANCGANRSLAAFLLNPEAAITLLNPEAATTPEVDDSMLLLKFNHGNGLPGVIERGIGCLNWYAMHPTNLGMYNSLISGDNKGWAALLFEASESATNADFVAGFANAACGDVSGNVVRDELDGSIKRSMRDGIMQAEFSPPLGKFGDSGEFQRNIKTMTDCGVRQFEEASRLYRAAFQEVTGKIDFRYLNLQISDVRDANDNRLTWEAAMGCSFGAGSMEDGEAYAYLLGIQIPSGIVEGITLKRFDDGAGDGIAALAAAGLGTAMLSASLGPLGLPIIRAALPIAGQILAVAVMNEQARAWVMNSVAYLALIAVKLPLQEFEPTNVNFRFTCALPAPAFLPRSFHNGHAPKPIMFPCGLAHTSNLFEAAKSCPMVPNKVPIQLLKIGQVAVAGIPGEITGIAGLWLKTDILAGLAGVATKVALGSYSNSYSGYITTEEEYGAQHYEGASTLYGPKTLAAYQQEFRKLADAIRTGAAVDPGTPEQLPGIYRRSF